MGLSQSNITFRSQIEGLSQPYAKPDVITKELMRISPMIHSLFKFTEGDDKITGLETFQNRYIKFGANSFYPYTSATINDMNINLGDDKNPINGRNIIYGEIAAVDKGFTMGITLEDKQRLEGYDTFAKVVNWIDDYWKQSIKSLAINLENAIFNGTGTTTNSFGQTRNEFTGLGIAIGNGTYGLLNPTTSNFFEWQSQGTISGMSSWDLTSATTVFGYTVSSTFDTTAHATTAATGVSYTPFYDLLQRALRQCRRFAPSGAKYAIFMPPWLYDAWFLRSLDVKVTSQKLFNMNLDGVKKGETNITDYDYPTFDYEISGAPVYSIDTTLVSDVNGSAPVYVFPKNKIYIINMNAIKLGVNKTNNFMTTPWENIPTQYQAMQRSTTATLAFWLPNRLSHGVITMYAAGVTDAGAQYGVTI